MKPVKMGRNLQLENISKSKHQHAQSVINQAKCLVAELIPLETLEIDIEIFKQSFVGYTSKFIKQDNVLKHLDPDSFINLTALSTLEKRYYEYRQPDNLNFDIFATTEHQVLAFDYSLKLCELLNSHPQKTEFLHHQRNTIIPLVEVAADTFIPDIHAISMLK